MWFMPMFSSRIRVCGANSKDHKHLVVLGGLSLRYPTFLLNFPREGSV